MQPMLNMAIKAARQAGNVLIRKFERRDELQVSSKGLRDFVSDADKAAERAILETLMKAYPTHSFLAEESGLQTGSDFEWVIDPLDGTTNYIHGHPQFAVSIGLLKEKQLMLGVIYDPLRDELFQAMKGNGAQLNNRRIRVGSALSLNDTLIGTGFPFRYPILVEPYLQMFKAVYPHVTDIRRAGSAALDLAYVAAGRLDGYWEMGLKAWDMAAGALIVREAGGFVTDFSGGAEYLETGNILAGNGKVLNGLLQTIQPCLIEGLRK